MEIAARAAPVFANYMTTALCSRWRPPFAKEAADEVAREVHEIGGRHFEADKDFQSLIQTVRVGIHEDNDRRCWEVFSKAVSQGVFAGPAAAFLSPEQLNESLLLSIDSAHLRGQLHGEGSYMDEFDIDEDDGQFDDDGFDY